jgi:lipoate-protein ligase A
MDCEWIVDELCMNCEEGVLSMVLIERKIPNGKLVRVEVQFGEGKIDRIKITGDFFMHPEDALVEIERRMIGLDATNPQQKIAEIFSSVYVEIIGFSADDISDMIREAYEKG